MNKYSTFIGMDLGDKISHYAVMTERETEVQHAGTVQTTATAMRGLFETMRPCSIAIEAGTHSPWVSRLLEQCGHAVVVANPRKTRAIYDNPTKNDRVDAEMLARLLRSDPQLLSPVQHQPQQEQAHLAIVKARDALVRSRSLLITTTRGLVKSMGERLPKCSADTFHKAVEQSIPKSLEAALLPLVNTISDLTSQIRHYDKTIATLGEDFYPECDLLQSVPGVGPVTALTFRLVVADPHRFGASRDLGAYFGLIPKKDQSGEHDPQLRITKTGNTMMRRLLVGAAQYILGPLNKTDSQLRQWGLSHAGARHPNGKLNRTAKKRAVVAVARKLAVLLHTLWINGTYYEPFPHTLQGGQSSNA